MISTFIKKSLELLKGPAKKWINISFIILLLALGIYVFINQNKQVEENLSGRINNETGLSFYAKLSCPSYGDNLENTARSDLKLFEDGKELGPGHALHDVIRAKGKGSYSHWMGYIFFSSSDNSSPVNNGKVYTIKYKRNEELLIKVIWITGALLLLYNFIFSRISKKISKRLFTKRNLFIFICIVVIPVSILLLIEIIFRIITPARITEFPSRFDDKLGFVLKPNVTFTSSGHLNAPYEYSTKQKSNSHGFLDKERTFEKPEGVFRIAILGDSFVEAVQVSMEEKLNIKLEEYLKSKGYKNVEVLAFGFSGMNTANLWAFYQFSKKFDPDMVILFQNGDLTRNHPEFNSIMNGWDKSHPPRYYFDFDKDGNSVHIPIDPDWSSHLKSKSKVKYNLAFGKYSVALGELMPKASRAVEDFIGYKFSLSKGKNFNPKGYDYPTFVTSMLNAEKLDDFLQSIFDYTELSLKEYALDSKKENISFILVQQPGMLSLPEESFELDGYSFHRDNMENRLENITKRLDIPALFLNRDFRRKADPLQGFWKYDGHFSPSGHQWSAEYIGNFLIDKKLIDKGINERKNSPK